MIQPMFTMIPSTSTAFLAPAVFAVKPKSCRAQSLVVPSSHSVISAPLTRTRASTITMAFWDKKRPNAANEPKEPVKVGTKNDHDTKYFRRELELMKKGMPETNKVERSQMSIQTLVDMYKDGTLDLGPPYQRGNVWKHEKNSALVMTVLCNDYVHPLVLYEKERMVGKQKRRVLSVVDGKQRITAVIDWYLSSKDQECSSTITPQFQTLSSLEDEYDTFEGMSFNDLNPDFQRRYLGYEFKTVILYPSQMLDKNGNDEMVFRTFKAMNTAGVQLTAQQIRRAMFNGPYIKLLEELRANKDFLAIRGKDEPGDVSDKDMEMILEMFAFKRYSEYKKKSKEEFLNAEMKRVGEMESEADMKNELQRLKTEFESVMRLVVKVFGKERAFRAWTKDGLGWGSWETRISTPLMDSIYAVFAELMQKEKSFSRRVTVAKNDVVESVKAFFEDESNQKYMTFNSVKYPEMRVNEFRRLIQETI